MMRASEIEHLAGEVLSGWGGKIPSVDVEAIANEEGIALAPGSYGENFCGRIEFHGDVGKFILFHPDLNLAPNSARVRFSIGHELGHYFIEHHRELLMAGRAHNSASGFICDEVVEREADEFAAALLIPSSALKQRLARRAFMTLEEILKLGNEWETSATSAAIRYAKFTSEACGVVISQGEIIKYYIPSEEAATVGFKFMGKGRRVPPKSKAAEAPKTPRQVLGKEASSEEWFSERAQSRKIWEESFALGYTGTVLTLLAFES